MLPSLKPARTAALMAAAAAVLTVTLHASAAYATVTVPSFTGMPDIPLTSVNVSFTGGSNTLFENGYSLCIGSPALSGSFTSQNGGTATASAPISVTS